MSRSAEDLKALVEGSSSEGALVLSEERYSALLDRFFNRGAKSDDSEALAISPRPHSRAVPTISRGELGVVPRSLLEAFALFDPVLDFILPQVKPVCARCGVMATPPLEIGKLSLPKDGYLLLAAEVGDDLGFSLAERCEMLGVQRALVDHRLCLIEQLGERSGEPVLLVVEAAKLDDLIGESKRWFERGGGALRVLHLTARDALATECGRLTGGWCCSGCQRGFQPVTRALLRDLEPCKVCSGAGWLEALDWQRLIECRECRGFGSLSEVADYRVGGVPLRDLMALTFREFEALLAITQAGSERLALAFQAVLGSSFAEYPLGAAVELLSSGELVLATALIGDLSGIRDGLYLSDRAVVGDLPTNHQGGLKILSAVKIGDSRLRPLDTGLGNGREVVLNDLNLGPLAIERLAFPQRAITAVVGQAGVGKSLLIATLATLFSKRNKFKGQAAFGSLNRSVLINGLPSENGVLLDLLGLDLALAEEVARSRAATEAGILSTDLVDLRSKYRCAECGGNGLQPHTLAQCGVCNGAVFDWRVANLPVADTSLVDLLTTPLGDLDRVLFFNDLLTQVVESFPSEYRGELTLATPVAKLSLVDRRFFAVWGGLRGVLGRIKGKKSGQLERDLVLIDGPRVMPNRQLSIIGDLLAELRSNGATIAYASIPEGLESGCDCVIRLEPKLGLAVNGSRRACLDTRYARGCVARVRGAIGMPT